MADHHLKTHYSPLRTCRFSPYRQGMGPHFRLQMWATDRTDERGQTVIAYDLRQYETGQTPIRLFSGEDFCGSPLHADDSDQAVASLMGFLTLRPGDTDADYFAGYTDQQREFCDQHAETLSAECDNRFRIKAKR